MEIIILWIVKVDFKIIIIIKVLIVKIIIHNLIKYMMKGDILQHQA